MDFALKMKLRKAYYIDEPARREGRSVEETARCPKCGSREKKILGGQQFPVREIGY